jgi:hypothetical protein
MHVLESYALQNDLKIDTPHLYEKFFPLAIDDYITIDTSSLNTSAMAYDHWQLVVNLISPILEKEDIKIMQLGTNACRPLSGCYNTLGQCNFNQKSYVINKSLLHASSNNEASHLASAYNKPLVVLFPNNCYVSQFEPYWSNPSNVEICQAEPKHPRPTYAPSESPKSINDIKPEDVAEKILRQLDLFDSPWEYRTLKIGSSFHIPRIESNLSHLIDANKLGVSSLIVRMDLNFNEGNLEKQLQACPCSIITNRPLSDNIINNYHSRIVELVYYIGDDNSVDFVKKVKSKSINYLLRTRKTSPEINDIKLKYLDYDLIHEIPRKTKNDFPELKAKNNIYFKSSQSIIHNGKFYPSSHSLTRSKHSSDTMNHDYCEVTDDSLFWEEEEHFHFFEKVVD